jgi:hypothetical protein
MNRPGKPPLFSVSTQCSLSLADPGRRSLLLDARRWPFFGALFAPVNRDNLHLREPSATHNSPKDVRDVEKAGSGHDLPRR